MTTAQKRRRALHRTLRSGDTPDSVNPTKQEAVISAPDESVKDLKPPMTRPPAHSGYHAGARR